MIASDRNRIAPYGERLYLAIEGTNNDYRKIFTTPHTLPERHS